jgi:hypothetical protein
MSKAEKRMNLDSTYYPSSFGEMCAERVARETLQPRTVQRISAQTTHSKRLSLFDDRDVKRLEFCGTIDFYNPTSENATLLRQFARKLPALRAAMNLSIESLTYWEMDVKHHTNTSESACLPESSAWSRFKCVDFILLLCNSAISLFHEASNSLPNMSAHEMSVMGPDLIDAAKILFPTIESNHVSTLLDEMYKHICAYLSCASLLWIELYDVEYRMFVGRKHRECLMNELSLDVLSNICSKALKRSTKNIAQQTSFDVHFKTNARWCMLLEHTNQYRRVNRLWATIPLFETRLCAVEWGQPTESLMHKLNDHSLPPPTNTPIKTRLQCYVLLLHKLESMLKTNQETTNRVEPTHPQTDELFALTDTLTKQCNEIRAIVTNNRPLHQYVVEHNKGASVYVSNASNWKLPAAAIYGISAVHNCNTAFDNSNGVQRLCHESHFVDPSTNFKWCTSGKLLCLRAQLVHSFFGVVFAHSSHLEFYHVRCQARFACSQEMLDRGETSETHDITDWLYREGLLRGTKQSDPRKLKLLHGGICAYFQLNTNSRNIHHALGKHAFKQNSNSYVRFNLVRGAYNVDEQYAEHPSTELRGEWMEVRTECKSRFLNTKVCGKRSRVSDGEGITDFTNTLEKCAVSVSVM